MTNLANNLTLYRKKSGLTQGQLGELLHVSAQAISKWENGQAEPSLDMILKLAEIYHITTDDLLTAEAPVESPITTDNLKKERKPSRFAAFLRKRWYLLLIVALLIGAAALAAAIFLAPKTHAKMIKDGEIYIGMSEAEARTLLGDPTDLIAAEDYHTYWAMDNDLNYGKASYYIYFEERSAKTDEELWFGVKYEFLRLVFDTDGKLIEAFACATPSTDLWKYGDTENLSMKRYAFLTDDKGFPTQTGTLELSDGSLYLGELTVSDGILQAKLGKFNVPSSDNEGGGNDGIVFTKECFVCGEEKSTCKNDYRLTGEPEPVCRDCREELDALLELD